MIEQERARPREDWYDAGYVESWLDQQSGRVDERMKSFAMIRAMVPRATNDSFSVLDVGGGDGWLAEVLLERFPNARVTVFDLTEAMLGRARARLQRFGDRASTAQGDLKTSTWTAALSAPYDVVVSTIAIHNLGDPVRIKGLYGEIAKVVAEGGCFLLYDYLRASDQAVQGLARWAATDPDRAFDERNPQRARRPERERDRAASGEHRGTPFEQRGSLEEQLSWFHGAGFDSVECFWKQFQAALIGGFKGEIRVPDER
jgi:tRNA (cmo5U34)-methyltransferase